MEKQKHAYFIGPLRVWPILEKRAISSTSNKTDWASIFGGRQSSSGQNVNENTAMQVSAVWACVRLISETYASLPFGVYQEEDDRINKLPNHPVAKLLKSPGLNTKFDFLETLMSSAVLQGNGVAYIHRNGGAQPQRLEFIPWKNVSVKQSTDRTKLFYDITFSDGSTITAPDYDVLHIKGVSKDGIIGMNPIEVQRDTIGIPLAEQQYQGGILKNGAHVAGYLKTGKQLNSNGFKNLTQYFRKRWQGLENTANIPILEDGTEFIPLEMKPADVEFLGQRKFSVQDIARIFRVQLHLIGDLERSTNNNIEHQSIEFVQHTMRPWVKRAEEELDRKLFTEKEKASGKFSTRFSLEGLLRGDLKSQAIWFRAMVNLGVYSQNDVRKILKDNPIPNGDKYWMQTSYQPIENAIKTAE